MKSLFFGSKIASEYCQVKPGGDLALFNGIAKHLFLKKKLDYKFIEGSTENFEQYKLQIEKLDWSTIENSSGLKRSEIEVIGDYYIKSKNTILEKFLVNPYAYPPATVATFFFSLEQ